MRTGDGIPALASWESNSDPADIPGLEIVADAGSLSGVGPSLYGATIYPGPRRDLLFNAASIWWAQGLTSPAEHMLPWSHGVRPHGPGRRVDRITANLLARAPGTGLI